MSEADNTENTYKEFFEALERLGLQDLAERIRRNEPMNLHTTMRVGGLADLFAEPAGPMEAVLLFRAAKESGIPLFVIGNGSNVIVSDDGIEGLTVHIGDAMSRIWTEADPENPDGVLIHAFAGVLLSKVAVHAARESYTGMEFAAGIPGSIGGAVYMNAGAYGGQMSDIVYQTVFLTPDGNMGTLAGPDHEFGYRESYFTRNGGTILSTVLRLVPGDKDVIFQKIKELAARRTASQPLTLPSAGSVFRRPAGYFAGTLIEESGLKGLRSGGAAVSEKHAGFIVNTGGATARDVYNLTGMVREEVYKKSGVILEPEILFMGRGFTTK